MYDLGMRNNLSQIMKDSGNIFFNSFFFIILMEFTNDEASEYSGNFSNQPKPKF
jgi:hypothetical protein